MSDTPHEGDVEIELNGKPAKLRFGVQQFKKIGAICPFMEVLRRIANLDVGMIVAVVAAGTGKTAKEVEGDVFETGMAKLVNSVSEYVVRLLNGGKPLPVDEVKTLND
jgi:hypothetical protein